MFYNYYYISKDEMNIIRTGFGDAGSYGSRFQSRCLGHNNYTGPRWSKKANITPIQGPVLKNGKIFHHKIDSFNVNTQIMDEKIINNLTIKASCAFKIIDTTFF